MADEAGAATDQPQEEDDPSKLANYWLNNIQVAERRLKAFRSRGRQIIRRYKNKRGTLSTTGIPLAQRRMNVLWANVQTQKPVLFSQLPKANVSARNNVKDPVARTTAMVMERSLDNSMDMQPFDYTMGQLIEDLLLPGMANAITEYVPEIDGDKLGWQEAKTRYIHWEDQVTNPARNAEEIWYWAYKVYLTRKEVRALVIRTAGMDENDPEAKAALEAKAQEISTEIVLDHKEDKNSEESDSKATVWCIWDKSTQRVLHVATGYAKAPLAVMPPPVEFDGFFPCPRALSATTASDSTVPVADFDQYQDQADEIDLLTQRINVLVRSLRLRGFYPADMDSIKQLMSDSGDSDMIPVDNWAMFSERGGAENVVGWFPIQAVAETLDKCYAAREQALSVMYEITGISDIMRGSTEASETATAQQLKSNYGNVRVRERQRDVQRYIRDTLRLQAEIIAEHFTQETLQAMSGVRILTEQQKQMILQYQQAAQQYDQIVKQAATQQPPPPRPAILSVKPPTKEMLDAAKEPTWEQVIDLLRNQKLRGFVIDVETDSTIEPDQQQEQQKASEFLAAITQFMTAAVPLAQAEPEAVPLIADMLSWGARQFKAGDELDGVIQEFSDKMKEKAANPQPPQPNPEMLKIQAEQQKQQGEQALEAQRIQGDHALLKEKQDGEAVREQQKIEGDLAVEMEKIRLLWAEFEQSKIEKEKDRQHQAVENEANRNVPEPANA